MHMQFNVTTNMLDSSAYSKIKRSIFEVYCCVECGRCGLANIISVLSSDGICKVTIKMFKDNNHYLRSLQWLPEKKPLQNFKNQYWYWKKQIYWSTLCCLDKEYLIVLQNSCNCSFSTYWSAELIGVPILYIDKWW